MDLIHTTDGTDVHSITSDAIRVHLEYDMDNLPPLPGEDWTRFVCLSDTHSQTFPVPAGDVLLHGGDLTGSGRVKDIRLTMDWIKALPHRTKIIIAGNHDLTLHGDFYKVEGSRFHTFQAENVDTVCELVRGQAAKDARIVYLEDESHEFQAKENGRTWTIYGSPWSPHFGGWAFNYWPEDAPRLISSIPKTDILMTHGPPLGIHDMTMRGVRAGCPTLLERVAEIQPRLHVFGHIHEGRGATLHQWDTQVEKSEETGDRAVAVPVVTAFVNAANYPLGSGEKVRDALGGRRMPGSPGWQPVIVDMRDLDDVE